LSTIALTSASRYVGADETDADLFLERAAFLLAASRDHDFGPFQDEGLGDPFADAARASGHNRDLASNAPMSASDRVNAKPA
jgi:hypothetical protein